MSGFKTRNQVSPPKWMEKIFNWYCDTDVAEEIQGDLYERFQSHAKKSGLKAARRKYFLNMLKFISMHTLRRRSNKKYNNPMIMYSNYVKVTLRNLSKNLSYTVINIAGLSIGLLCFILIFTYVKHELSFDKFHENQSRIYRIPMTWLFGETEFPTPAATTIAGPLVTTEIPGAEKFVRFTSPRNTLVKTGASIFEEKGFLYADSTLFDIFSFEMLEGNPATALIDPNSVVLSRQMAIKYFGSDWQRSVVTGQSLDINNGKNFRISGVMEDLPDNSHIQFDFVASFSSLPESNKEPGWDNSGYYTYVMFSSAVSLDELKEQLSITVEKKFGKDFPVALDAEALQDIYLYSKYGSGWGNEADIDYVYIFSAIASLILIIACINYMNLITAKSIERAKEVGLRKVLGANRGQLFAQFMSETFIITMIALIIGYAGAQLLIPFFNNLSGKVLDAHYLLEGKTLLMVLGLGLMVSLMAGIYPAIILSGYIPIKVLKGKFMNSGSGTILRKTLIVFQFAVSMLLICGTLVIYQQLNYIQDKRLGYEKDNVIIIRLDNDAKKNLDVIKNEIASLRDVKGVTAVNEPINKINFGTTFNVVGKDELNDRQIIIANKVDENFLPMFEFELLAGRNIDKISETDNSYYYVLNQSASQFFGWKPQEAIGNKLRIWGSDTGTVIGVIKDFHFSSLREKIEPLVLFSDNGSFFYDRLMIKISNENITNTMTDIEKKWKTLVPHRPFEYEFLDESFDALYRSERRFGELFMVFAALAIIIACMGLFGLSSFTAIQKSKEIGIRKVMGASIASLLGMLIKNFSILVIISAVIAIPAAYFLMGKWLEGFAYKVSVGFEVLLTSGILALIIAILTISYQSMKAALANPAQTLRNNE